MVLDQQAVTETLEQQKNVLETAAPQTVSEEQQLQKSGGKTLDKLVSLIKILQNCSVL